MELRYDVHWDLKSATDRWPLLMLFETVQYLFDRSLASSVVNLDLACNIFDVPFVKKLSPGVSLTSLLWNLLLRKQMSSHPCKHQNMHSRDLQSPYGLLLKKKNQIKLVTEQTFFASPALTDLSGQMLQSALLLSKLVVFHSEIAFTSHMTSVPTDFLGNL